MSPDLVFVLLVVLASLLGFAALMAGLLLGVGLFLRRLRTRALAEALTLFPGEILREAPQANFVGQRSDGKVSVRGTGCLLLTRKELGFLMWVPRRPLHIPIADINLAERASSYQGKRGAYPILLVSWRDAKGAEDQVGFMVPDADAWVRDIQSLQQGSASTEAARSSLPDRLPQAT